MSYAISFFGIFARIIDSLAWPAVAVFLIWVLRDVLRQAVGDLLSRPASKPPESTDPKTALILAMHEIRDRAETSIRSGVLGPEQSRAARLFVDQVQQAIVAIVSGRPLLGAAAADEPLPEQAPRPEAAKRKKKPKSPKGG